jgi:4-hydroxy-tetrahydrodipicolinate synthase
VRGPFGDLLTAMVTPFTRDGAVDLGAARRLARQLVEHGSDGVVVCGTTGEGPTLSDREKLDLFDAVVAEVGGTAPVVANTGTYDTHHSTALTRAALSTGVDGFLVVTPYYSKPPPAGIVAHYQAVAGAADGRPVIVYNIPSRVVVNIPPPLMARLAEIENVVAVKQATPDPEQARAILRDTDLALYAGNDDLVLPFTRLGGAGGICVASHVVGPRIRELIRLAREAPDRAEAADAELRPLYDALAVTTNPIPIKAALNLLGHEVGGLRLPLVAATGREVGVVREALARLGVAATVAV